MKTSKRLFTVGIIFTVMAIIVLSIGCNPDSNKNDSTDAVVTEKEISGLDVPETGGVPDTDVPGSDQYSVTSVSWAPSDSPFEDETIYTATIVLEAKTGYTFDGVDKDSFTVTGATVTNPAGTGKQLTVTAVFPATANPETVTLLTISDLEKPITGQTPDTSIPESDEYSVTSVSWTPSVDGVFAGATEYTATIVLEAKTGYTFKDLATDSFTVTGATVTNPAGTGKQLTVKAVFEATKFAQESGVDGVTDVGTEANIYYGSSSTKIIYASDGGFTIPTGEIDNGKKDITTKFWIAETETTLKQASEILNWALANGKFNTTDSGSHNYLTSTSVKYNGRLLFGITSSGQYIKYKEEDGFHLSAENLENCPASHWTWFGAIMLCNWLTEMRDGNTDNIVYTGIPTDGTWTNKTMTKDITKTGYRLPSSYEWECAARYRGTDATNTVSGTIDGVDFGSMEIKWTKGNSASGAIADVSDSDASNAVAQITQESITLSVKTKAPNALGLYDMSGNVIEWIVKEVPNENNYIYLRGGSNYHGTSFLKIGDTGYFRYNYEDSQILTFSFLGLRFVRTAP